MARIPYVIVMLCLLHVAGMPSNLDADAVFEPAWRVGQRWVVESVYPDPMGRDDRFERAFWEYRVVEAVAGPLGGGYRLEVRPADAPDAPPVLSLLYGPGGHRLLRVESTTVFRGQERGRVFAFDLPEPVATRQSPAPFDAPVFPAAVPSVSTYSVSREIAGGLTKSTTIRQQAQSVTAGELDLPGVDPARPLVAVRCSDSEGNEIFVQYWDPGRPWPVYGRNPHMHYRLVE